MKFAFSLLHSFLLFDVQLYHHILCLPSTTTEYSQLREVSPEFFARVSWYQMHQRNQQAINQPGLIVQGHSQKFVIGRYISFWGGIKL